jgi:peptidoglycan/LPS O-acetylase OafA/YrhL
MSATPVNSGMRIPALDGFRGLAILMVTLYRFAEVSLTSEVIGKLPSQAIYLGASGVDFFFVLSGFLITGILVDAKHEATSYFARFYYRRCLRIFPLYFATLVLLLVILPVGWGNTTIGDEIRGDVIHLWIYTMNLKMAWLNDWCYGSLNHFWSLAIEEQYYLVWPLVVYGLGPRALLRFCLGTLCLCAAARIGFSFAELGSVSEKTFTLFRLDGLLLGASAALLIRNLKSWQDLLATFRLAGCACGVLYLGTLMLGGSDLTLRYTLISGVAVCLLLATIAAPAGSLEHRMLDNVPLRSLGKYSYAMYVFQAPLIPLLQPWVSVDSLRAMIGNPILAGLLYIGLMFSLTYFAAVGSWHGFEKWFLQFRDATRRVA